MSLSRSPGSPEKAGLTILYNHRTRARDGQSVHIDELIHALREEGHTVIVVEPRRVDAMATTPERALLPRFAYELAELAYSVPEFLRLARAVRRVRPHAFYQRANMFMLSGMWLSRLLRIPYLLEVNAPLAAERIRFGGMSWPALGRWSERVMWRSASVVLPVTHVLARTVAEAGVSAARITVTPNGVDPARFTPVEAAGAKRSLGLDAPLVLGFVGYVREWHGLEDVVDLLAREPALAHAHFLIVGDGPARGPLEQRARERGVANRVTITGVIERGDMPRYISAFDIALQAEVTPYASPLKLFEYMVMRRAVVAPATENILEILDHEKDALLFRHGDLGDFCAAITRLAGDAALRARLGEGAAAKIEARALTWRGNARKVADIARRLSQRATV